MKTALTVINEVEQYGELLDNEQAVEVARRYAKEAIEEMVKQYNETMWKGRSVYNISIFADKFIKNNLK